MPRRETELSVHSTVFAQRKTACWTGNALTRPQFKRPRKQQVSSRITIQASTLDDPDAYEIEALPSGKEKSRPGILRSAKGVVGSFGRALAAAPRASWESVRVTTGAAAELMFMSREDTATDVESESDARWSSGNSAEGNQLQDGPVGRARERWREAQHDMPEGTWGRIQWLWDQPPVKKLRITITAAQWSFRLPAIIALLATQSSLIASQLSLPLVAPLLLGLGMTLRSIRSNASIIFPRICVLVVLLYLLWFLNSVVQNTVVYLRRQGALEMRVSGAIITASECFALVAAFVIVLTTIGVNVNALLLPAGVAVAYAAKDLSHNFLAGFFLFVVQPFKLGDRISVSYSSAAAASSPNRSAWFEGTCEKVDLRYTVVKSGPRRLFVPNSAFLTREFLVVEDPVSSNTSGKRDLFPAEEAYLQEEEQPSLYCDMPGAEPTAWPPRDQQYSWPESEEQEQPAPQLQPKPARSPGRQWKGNGWQYQPRPETLQSRTAELHRVRQSQAQAAHMPPLQQDHAAQQHENRTEVNEGLSRPAVSRPVDDSSRLTEFPRGRVGSSRRQLDFGKDTYRRAQPNAENNIRSWPNSVSSPTSTEN